IHNQIFFMLNIISTYPIFSLQLIKLYLCLIVHSAVWSGVLHFSVTGVDHWGAVMSTGVACTLYCTLGGLKAVVWTDVFQVGIMLAGLLAVIVQSVLLQGGISTIISDSAQGGRLNLWDFDPNPLRRHTFWSITVGGTFLWTSVYGIINQAQVQRYISCKSMFHLTDLVNKIFTHLKKIFEIMVLYWHLWFHKDPSTSMEHFHCTGSLCMFYIMFTVYSTVSSSVNALAAVTIADLIRPYLSLSEQQLSWASKGMSLFYGAVCIRMAGVASLMGGMLQAAISIAGVVGGPLLGLFSLGILFPCANAKGGLAGLISGLVLSLWVCIRAQIYPPRPENSRPLALVTHSCKFSGSTNWTDPFLLRPFLADNWYLLSYLYFGPLGTVTVITVGLVVSSILSGGRQMKVQSGLTISKEDLTFYKAYNVLKAKELDKSFGKNNFAFCDVELSTQTSA
uniref:Solute carrier family 5 member 8 n=1 Tax=Sinocyclocheilus rhinocerous TaxID=307959 RepID=A0A673NHV2_9TELE